MKPPTVQHDLSFVWLYERARDLCLLEEQPSSCNLCWEAMEKPQHCSWAPASFSLREAELIERLNLSRVSLPSHLLHISWQIISWFPLWFSHYFKLHVLQLLSGLVNLFIVRNAETFRNDLSARIRNLIGNYVAQTTMKSWRAWYCFYFNCS